MPKSRLFNFILIFAGGLIALYANAEKEQDVYILLAGIILLMIGLYRLSRGISSKKEINRTLDNFDEEE
jgi:hypothetical membrane protein